MVFPKPKEIEKMAYMTEEEADALDEELTRTIPKVDFSKPDIFIRQHKSLNVLNPNLKYNLEEPK